MRTRHRGGACVVATARGVEPDGAGTRAPSLGEGDVAASRRPFGGHNHVIPGAAGMQREPLRRLPEGLMRRHAADTPEKSGRSSLLRETELPTAASRASITQLAGRVRRAAQPRGSGSVEAFGERGAAIDQAAIVGRHVVSAGSGHSALSGSKCQFGAFRVRRPAGSALGCER
jgi:hypothetical protein